MRANAISGSWSGTEEENFARIDAQFGEGTNLDILWRCIYRNSLSLNDASSSLGELISRKVPAGNMKLTGLIRPTAWTRPT